MSSTSTNDDNTIQESGRRALSLSSLTGMLGWNSVAVFNTETHADGDTLHVNKDTVYLVLTDPCPEYKQFVFLNGEFHHADDLLSMEYKRAIKDHLEEHGEAEIHPLHAVDFIERDEKGIPQYVGSEGDS